MSIRRKLTNNNNVYFCTVTCANWLPLFEIAKLYNHIYEWFEYLNKKDIKTIGFVIMPNHLHVLLYLPGIELNINKIIGNCKRFMAYEVVKRLAEMNMHELLNYLADSVQESDIAKGKKHNVFEPSFEAKIIVSQKFMVQKLNYIHQNPVRGKWKLVDDYRKYEHSSAGFYESDNYNGYKVTHYMEL